MKILLPFILLTSCAGAGALGEELRQPPINHIIPTRGPIGEDLLKFISPGITTQEDVLLELGEPECFLQEQNVFVYWWVSVGYARMLHEDYLLIAFDTSGNVQKFKPFSVMTYQWPYTARSHRKKFDPDKLMAGW